jgi:serine/threonine protein kinase
MSSARLSLLLAFLREKEFLTKSQWEELAGNPQFSEISACLRELVRRQWLTRFQVSRFAEGNEKDLVVGPYRLIEPIGEGGMGKVFKARHVRMDRTVALKIIPSECLDNPNAVSRFYREVRAVAQLSHPNIVTAFEVNQEGRTHYFTMELMEGIDLARLVRESGRLPIPQACDYIRQAALGLQHAHEKGLVHRDVKPGNLIVGRSSAGGSPVVKILDFGLARFESPAGKATRLTKIGAVLGTVDYISPEQAGDAREVDIRSDIFSLGCTLFYLLTGKTPFAGAEVIERIMARLLNDAPSVRSLRPEVPAALEKVLAKMLARNPADRYGTPVEIAAALEPFTALAQTLPAGAGMPASSATALAPGEPPTISWSPWNFDEASPPEPQRKVKVQRRGIRGMPLWALVGAGSAAGVVLFVWSLLRNDNKETVPPMSTLPPRFTNSLGMEFALVPKGKSWLGGGGGNSGDKEVEIAHSFYLGVYEVTQEEWEKVTGLNPSVFTAVPGVSKENQKRFPVDNVSWEDAQWFLKVLNALDKQAGWVYRLPKEAEWEYACRGGPLGDKLDSAFDFYFEKATNELLPGDANFEPGGGGKGLKRPCKVGSYKPNRLGLYDMHGNIWEWCDDPVPDANNPKAASQRVNRGGGWPDGASYCRAGNRDATANPPPTGAPTSACAWRELPLARSL